MTKTKKTPKAQGGQQETSVPPQVPIWAVQPHLYQSLILKWFETIHKDFQELGSILERIEAKLNED